MRYLVGSKRLNLDNPHDEDYLVITKRGYKRTSTDGIDEIQMSKSIYNQMTKFSMKNEKYEYLQLFAYQLDNKIIGDDFPYKYSVLKYKKKLLAYLNKIVDEKQFNFNKRISQNENCCSKIIYHIAYNVFILENDSVDLTEEQKVIVQKLHDGKMPIEYIDTLKQKIKEELKHD